MSNLSHPSLYGYQVEQELGHNRVGGRITCPATNTTTQQPVVIKQFQLARSGSGWLRYQAYEQELKVLQKLHHPSLPCYLNSFETPARFGFVQEYKKVPSLAQPRHFTPLEVKQIAVAVLEILVYLQQQTPPIIHRDIKPENILVDRSSGRIKVYLVDFGLARIGGEEVAASSAAKDTLGFTSPEQLFNRQLTEASDLYSLGVTLICLLTKTKSTEVGNLINKSYRINFKPLLPRLNRRFIDWLEKMVAPSLKNRYPNAATALEVLKPIPVFPSQNQMSATVLVTLMVGAVLVLGLGKTLSDKYLESSTSLYYTVTDLGTLPGGICSCVSDINEAGQVVGHSVLGNRKQHLFLWNNGNITDLSSADDNYSSANSINNKGQVVGWSSPTTSGYHAFLWENHTKTDLGTLGGAYASAHDINDAGEVVGDAATSRGSSHAILWNTLNNTKTDLGTLGGYYSRAYAINNVSQVVGASAYTTSSSDYHAFLWHNSQMIDLGTLGGNNSKANGINKTGQVVGSSETSSGSKHAVLWHHGTKTDLGTLSGDNDSNAQDINDQGTIVGWSSNTINSNSFRRRAVVWKNGTISNLNNLIPPNSGWELYAAQAINNRGQIVGNGRHNDATHAFLLTPAKKP